MSQVNFFSLAKQIKIVLPGWNTKPDNHGVFVWSQDDFPVTISVKPAPAVPGEAYTEINTGIDYKRLGPVSQLLVRTHPNWFTKHDRVYYLIPRCSVKDLIKQLPTQLQQVTKKVIRLEQILVQADAQTKLILQI